MDLCSHLQNLPGMITNTRLVYILPFCDFVCSFFIVNPILYCFKFCLLSSFCLWAVGWPRKFLCRHVFFVSCGNGRKKARTNNDIMIFPSFRAGRSVKTASYHTNLLGASTYHRPARTDGETIEYQKSLKANYSTEVYMIGKSLKMHRFPYVCSIASCR